jgi:hypothetical protein
MAMPPHDGNAFRELGDFVNTLSSLNVILMRWAAQCDAGFRDRAIAEFDEILGRLPLTEGVVELRAKNRELFHDMLEEAMRQPTAEPVPSPKKPTTLRRRFLEWLQAG